MGKGADDGDRGEGTGVDPGGVLQIAKLIVGAPSTTKATAIVFGATGFVVLGGKWIDRMGAAALREACGPWLFGAFAVSGAVLAVEGLGWVVVGPPRTWREESRRWRRTRERLGQLTEEEKTILRGYIEGRTRTQNQDPFDTVVMDLVDAELIAERPGEFFVRSRPYTISERVWKYLHENPGLLASGLGVG